MMMQLFPESNRHVDVVIVGLGLSGLSALRMMSAAGVSTLGIDARDRIGGKTETIKSEEGRSFEGGPEFVKPGHERMRSLIREFGLGLLTVERRGHRSIFRNGIRWTEHHDYIDPGLLRLKRRFDQLKADFKKGVVEKGLEECSVGTWLGMQDVDALQQTRFAHDLVFELSGTDPFAVSMAATVSYHAAAGQSHDQSSERIVGGGSAVAEKLAAGLDPNSITLNTMIHAVNRHQKGVELQTTRGTVTASFAVLAVSPTVLNRMSFSPALPERRHRLISGWTQQAATKSFVVFERQWWKSIGLSGFAEGEMGNTIVMNASRPGEREGTLLLFENGVAGGPRISQHETKARALKDLERYFGYLPCPVIDFATKSWGSDPLSSGCGSPLPPRYPVNSRSELAKPIENIFFAGTEVAEQGWGSMEGAVRAGEAAADRILSIIKN